MFTLIKFYNQLCKLWCLLIFADSYHFFVTNIALNSSIDEKIETNLINSSSIKEDEKIFIDENVPLFPCGKSRITRNPRIVGGKSSLAGEFPWTVSD